jgi:hypothetical protein
MRMVLACLLMAWGVGCICVGLSRGQPSCRVVAGEWLRLPDLPEGKEQFGFESCMGRLYAVAGVSAAGETGRAFYYDVASGVWVGMAPLPVAVQSLCLRAAVGRLFAFGGYDSGRGVKYDRVWEYDEVLDTWNPRASMPVACEDMGSAVVDGSVWLVGGVGGPGHRLVSQVQRYECGSDRWRNPVSVSWGERDWGGRALGDFCCAVNGRVWCLGGTERLVGYPGLWPSVGGLVFGGKAVERLPLRAGRCYAEVEAVGDLVYVVGGCRESTSAFFTTMDILDIVHREWLTPVRLPYGARGQGVCSWDGVLYVAGGWDGQVRKDFYAWRAK